MNESTAWLTSNNVNYIQKITIIYNWSTQMSRKKLRSVTKKSKFFGIDIKKRQICFAMTASIVMILDG